MSLIGCDPSAKKFSKFYKKNIEIFYSIFDEKISKKISQKCKLITAIAMFYDLKLRRFVKILKKF